MMLEFTRKINQYFGIENKNMALWFYGGLGFPIACGTIAFIVSVVI